MTDCRGVLLSLRGLATNGVDGRSGAGGGGGLRTCHMLSFQELSSGMGARRGLPPPPLSSKWRIRRPPFVLSGGVQRGGQKSDDKSCTRMW